MEVLCQPVLVLNKNWQPVDEIDVATALANICKGSMRGMDTSDMRPLAWDDWLKLPIRETDLVIRSIRGPVRVPRVVLASVYDGMPETRPKLDRRGIGERDGYRCGYTGIFCPDGDLDHIDPRSRGGKRTWENLTWSSRSVNRLKRDRTPAEAGLTLRHKPKAPVPVKACMKIKAKHPEWQPFVYTKK